MDAVNRDILLGTNTNSIQAGQAYKRANTAYLNVEQKPATILGLRKANSHWMPINVGNNRGNEDAAGVGIITKQNTTKDVKPGDEYKNVKKLHLR